MKFLALNMKKNYPIILRGTIFKSIHHFLLINQLIIEVYFFIHDIYITSFTLNYILNKITNYQI
jgi:hypothetical protein